jgi:uncharacterized protein with ParB-like and HNH nuclease domain
VSEWISISVSDAVRDVISSKFVLPVIQRRLVWEKSKMELLFDTLLKGNSFGGVMVIEEERGRSPLFESREFTRDGTNIKSTSRVERLLDDKLFVIDGQQRLQSFYMCLIGNYNGDMLYFNLNSDFENEEFDFKFSNEKNKLPAKVKLDSEETRSNVWYLVRSLYEKLGKSHDHEQCADEILSELNVSENDVQRRVRRNISKFYQKIFAAKTIGICKVPVNRTFNETLNRQKVVELFRRLNDGGTKLTGYDLVASVLKAYNWRMEGFLDETIVKHSSIGIGHDELLKLILLLQDNNKKEVTNIEAGDADFAISKAERIKHALVAVENFLSCSNLYNFYKDGSRSAVPLYFIAYHAFHQNVSDDDVSKVFDKYDVGDVNFSEIYKWLYSSLLHGVFKSKGVGWIPYTTGVRKILEVVKGFKGGEFNAKEIFKVYNDHPLHNFQSRISDKNLDNYDFDFMYYIIYDKKRVVRQQDVDHIHPKSILEEQEVGWDDINNIGNFQLIDSRTNRGVKNSKELADWILQMKTGRDTYLGVHLIPDNKKFWLSKNYDEFLNARRVMIVEKLKRGRII